MREANKIKPIYYCFEHIYDMFINGCAKETGWLGNNTNLSKAQNRASLAYTFLYVKNSKNELIKL